MKRILSALLALVICVSFAGCSHSEAREQALYEKQVKGFFEALDKGDKEGVKAYFSKTAQKYDPDLSENIDKLFSAYPRGSSDIKFAEVLAGEYENDYGSMYSCAYSTLPVVNGENIYWFDIEYVYEDDDHPDNVGLSRVYFSTADEYCLSFSEEGEPVKALGLEVFAERKVEGEIRCINRIPYEFSQEKDGILLSEVKAFLKETDDHSAFTEKFGAAGTEFFYTYYEVIGEDDKVVYLELDIVDNKICYAAVYDEFSYIETIIEENY